MLLPVRALALGPAVADALAGALLEQVAGLAAERAELVEAVERAVRADEGDGLLALLDGHGDERQTLQLEMVEEKHDLAQRTAEVAEVRVEAIQDGPLDSETGGRAELLHTGALFLVGQK